MWKEWITKGRWRVERLDWDDQKLNNASVGQLDRQERDTALSLRSFHWLELTDAEHSRQLELTLNKSRFLSLHYIGNSSISPDNMYSCLQSGKQSNEMNASRAWEYYMWGPTVCCVLQSYVVNIHNWTFWHYRTSRKHSLIINHIV